MGEGRSICQGLRGPALPDVVWFLNCLKGCAFEKRVRGPVARQVPSRFPGHRKQLLLPYPGLVRAPRICS